MQGVESSVLAKRSAPSNAAAFIDAEFVQSLNSKDTIPVINPATERELLRIPAASPEIVNRAVKSAKLAFNGIWGTYSGTKRAEYLIRIAEICRERKNDLAILESLDSGKPLKETFWDLDDVSGCFEYFANQAKNLDALQDKDVDVGMPEVFKCSLRYDAVGVCAAVIPWNYPLLMLAWKVAPALAAGCTVVLKPSEVTPITALEFCRVAQKAGLPKGVFNLLIGAGNVGSMLVNHPDVDKIGFTGSVPTGIKIMEAASKRICNICLELGGKSPLIIFDDAEIENAVEWAMFGCFWTNGQICSSTSRVLVHEKIADAFFKRLAKEVSSIPIINPLDPKFAESTGVIGPLVNKTQYEKVLGFINGAISEGATVLAGGRKHSAISKGYFIEPTVLKVTPTMRIWKEEVFGPVMSVLTFKTESEAIELANNSEFGLAAAVISKDTVRCDRVVKSLRAGITWVNCSQPAFVQLPWGGLKKSGIGRELGSQGMFNYLEPKQITRYISKDAWGWYIKPSAKL